MPNRRFGSTCRSAGRGSVSGSSSRDKSYREICQVLLRRLNRHHISGGNRLHSTFLRSKPSKLYSRITPGTAWSNHSQVRMQSMILGHSAFATQRLNPTDRRMRPTYSVVFRGSQPATASAFFGTVDIRRRKILQRPPRTGGADRSSRLPNSGPCPAIALKRPAA